MYPPNLLIQKIDAIKGTTEVKPDEPEMEKLPG